MSVVFVTDVFCDECHNWGNHSSGRKADGAGAKEAIKGAGWKTRRGADGGLEDVCPACLGAEPDFWFRWYEKDRGIAVRHD
jgi:hypothetical protein